MLTAVAHPTDLGVVDVCHLVPGAALVLTASGGTRLVVQNNGEQLDVGHYAFYMLNRTLSAEDVSRGRVRLDTGLRQIVVAFGDLYRSATDTTPETYTGVITSRGGVIELTQGTASGVFGAGNVAHFLVLGVL